MPSRRAETERNATLPLISPGRLRPTVRIRMQRDRAISLDSAIGVLRARSRQPARSVMVGDLLLLRKTFKRQQPTSRSFGDEARPSGGVARPRCCCCRL